MKEFMLCVWFLNNFAFLWYGVIKENVIHIYLAICSFVAFILVFSGYLGLLD